MMSLGSLLADFAGMVRFYSRLPVPALSAEDRPEAMPVFSRAVTVLPFAGALIGLPAAVALGGAALVGLPPLLGACLALAVQLLVTGALHEDGLADTADGFGGGRDKARKLEIMKDSRLGSYGASALVLSLVARVAAWSSLLTLAGPAWAAALLVTIAGLSRVAAMAVMCQLPPARADGAGSVVGLLPRRPVAIGVAIGAALFAAAAWPATSLVPLLVAFALLAVAVGAVIRLAGHHIGGQTGDVVGAAQQAGELALLIGLLISVP
jgi:adenosylcobinamide-GDP ribazoletransferase